MNLAVASILVHTILFVSIFDIYFTSPVDRGMTPQYYSMRPPAKRVMLLVADGLRADTIFSLDEEGQAPAPFLRDIIRSKGRWGVSHTHVPTESRPGHVALIAGLYEDVSAVTKGWQENPVEFDSAFNRSRHTWAWGSPDILPMFSRGAEDGRVEAFTYDSSWEDFADSDASKLDLWVFERVKDFFDSAKSNRTLAHQLKEDKVVFFLHLLGIDTNGHAHRPRSNEVMDNLKFVDSEIKKIVDVVDSFYEDDHETTYIFTSDHGMTDWGSHGAGLPEETMTPLICWGAGIKNPRSSSHSKRVYHDGYSEKWDLQNLERVDVEQADIAPFMTALFGGAYPVNSEGVLPVDYIHYNKGFIAESLATNSRQLYERVRVKENRLKTNSLPFMFRSFPRMSNVEMVSVQEKIEQLIRMKQYQDAIKLIESQIEIYREAVKYYHTYHRSTLLVVISMGFFGWMVCVCISILNDKCRELSSFRVLDPNDQYLPKKSLVIWFLICCLLYYQASPLMYYLYYTLTLSSWSYAWRKRSIVQRAWRLIKMSPSQSFKVVLTFIVVLCGLEMLVVSFFYRGILFLILIMLSLWPYTTELWKKEPRICLSWTVVCVIISIFPLLPVIGRSSNYYFVVIAGVATSLMSLSILSVPSLNYLLCSVPHNSFPFSKFLFYFQNVLLVISSIVPTITNWFFAQKDTIPVIIPVFSWCNLLWSVGTIYFGPRSVTGRLLYLSLSLFPTFLLLSTSFEAIFVLLLCICLYLWLAIEDKLANTPAHHRTCSLWEGIITHYPPKVVTLLPNESELPRPSVSVDDLRRVFLSIFFGLFSFFGTGNIASVNSFDPSTVYCFLTVFSPFIMGALIIWKLVIPFVLVSCVFNVLVSLLNRSLKANILLMLIMADIMGLNFFFLVKDSGSWLDIGVSISHYVIVMVMVIGIVILIGVARLLTGVTVIPRKGEDH